MDRTGQGQNKQLLHYGCLVYLTFKDDNGQEYLVTADGYTKNKILLKKKEDVLKFSSISSCLFKIYPTFYNNEYQKALKVKDEKGKIKKFSIIEMRNAQLEIPKNIKAMEDETTLNHEQYEKFKGSPVVFGQTIQLLHINSNKYLYYDSNHVSEIESNNLKLSLIDEHSDETCYRITPCYTFQQEGSGNIYHEDIVHIVSTVDQTKKIGGEPYLHASRPKIFDTKSSTQKEKREVNISTEKKTPWKVNIFAEYLDEREGFLSIQDTVWINYSEQDLNLIGIRDQIKQQAQNQKSELHIFFEQCTQSANYTKFVGNSNGLFTIESESMLQGGLVKWETPMISSSYRLRHLTTKKYLKVIEEKKEGEEKSRFILTSVSDYQKASLFHFELIFSTLTTYNREKAQIYLQKDSYFRASTYVSQDQVWLRTESIENDDENKEIKEKKKSVPAFNKVKKEEYVFKIAKANFNEVRMTNFLLSCLKTIKGAQQYMDVSFLSADIKDEKFQKSYKGFVVHMQRLSKCLSELQLFCHNKLIAYLYIDQEFGQINHFIQNVLREQQFIELLVKILCVSFPDVSTLDTLKSIEQSESMDKIRRRVVDESNKNRDSQIKKEYYNSKKKICSLIYQLLDCICQQNIINQEQASRYIPIFAQQSVYIDDALKCIVQIIRDHEDLLLRLHQQVNDDDDMHQSFQQEQEIVMANHSNAFQQQLTIEDYRRLYDQIIKKILNESHFQLKQRWDLLQFYTNLLKEKSTTAEKKRDIISFLQFASTHKGKGLNVNQEGIYKCLIDQYDRDKVFKDEVLIKFEEQDMKIKLFVKGEEKNFVEFFMKTQKKKQHFQEADGDEIGKSKQLNNFLKKQTVKTPSQELKPKLILSLVTEQLQFYISMCNTRNNTWKRFVEYFLKYNVLIDHLWTKEQNKEQNKENLISPEMRAIICKLMNKVYLDQEPRREIIFPELCKVVITGNENELVTFDDEEGGQNQSDDQLQSIKNKLSDFISNCGENVDKMSSFWDMTAGEAKQRETLKQISIECPKTYNKLTLEMIRTLKLLITFGKYRIILGNSPEDTKAQNENFFSIIKQLFTILEFDPKYPESRKILQLKRAEDKKGANQGGQQLINDAINIFSKIGGLINVFSLIEDKDAGKDKKKKQKNIAFESGPLNMNESFLKQADVLKKILIKFLQESSEDDQQIKLEICDILNQYLDQKMDYCLNQFKQKFKDYANKIKQKLFRDEPFNLTSEADRKKIEQEFQDAIKKQIKSLIPSILKTGTDADKRGQPKSDNFNIRFNLDLTQLVESSFEVQEQSKEIDAIDIYTILGFEIFPTLINLFCMSQSLDMQTKILNVLTRFYNQREEFAELVSKILLLFDSQNIKIFSDLKKKMRQLAKNIDESETWIKDPTDPDNEQILRQTIEYFEFINNLLYKDSTLVDNRVEVPNRDHIDEFRQSIMRNLKVHDMCVQLITDCIGVTEKQFEGNTRHQIQNLFKNIFLLLKNFTINNSTNQLLLSEHLNKLQMKMELGLGQLDLINEIFRDNKRICIEKPGTVIDNIRKLIKTNGRQSKFLEFFILIQKVKKEFILSNQKGVLNMLLDPAYKSSIFWLKDRQAQVGEKNQAQSSIKHEFDFTPAKNDNPNYQDEPYSYHSTLIEVLYTCAIGKEGMLQNESRLRTIISLKYALEILCAPDGMTDDDIYVVNPRYDKYQVTQLKVPLLKYVYYTYLESEKIAEEIFKCITDLQDYVNAEKIRIEKFTKLPLSAQYQEYFFTHFFTLMNGFLRLYQKEQNDQNLVHQNQAQVHQEIENLFGSVKKLRDLVENNQELNSLKLTQQQTDLRLYFLCDNIVEEELLQKQKKEEEEKQQALKLEEQIQEEKRKNKKKQMTFNIASKLMNMDFNKQKNKQQELPEDETWKQLWQMFMQTFLNSKELLEEIKKEQKIFSEALEKVESIYSKDPLIQDHINKTEIFKKLITFLSKGHNQPGCEQTIKQVLRALSNYIIISEDTDTTEQDEEKQAEMRQQVREDRQNFLNSNNAMATILVILSDYKDINRYNLLYNSLLSFGIEMMEGGNREVQKSVYNFFVNFTSSEVFFLRLHERFEDQKAELKKEDEDEDDVKYNFQDEPEETQNTLRFLQLLVEGHYTELQNYMRFQQMNYHTYDLFTDVVELLGEHLNVKKTKYFYCMIQCFDTITEYVQGPCFENQQALFQANFLDMATNLLGFDERLEEIELRKKKKALDEQSIDPNTERKKNEVFPRWMYARLKYKCSITLLSLLEGRKSNDVIIRLAKSFNLEMLKVNIIDIYDMYKSLYKDNYTAEIFSHFSIEPDIENKETQEGKTSSDMASFIIETGFNLFVLYSTFLEVKDPSDGGGQKESEKKDDIMEQFKATIVGEVVFLAINIVNGVKDFFLNFAQKLNQAVSRDKNEIDYEQLKEQIKASRTSLFKDSIKFFSSNSAHIEVLREDKMLEKTYFYLLPYCKSLDKPTKTQFNQEAKRISVKAKVTSMLQESPDLIKKMKLTYQIQSYLNKIKVLALIVSKIQLYRDITFILALTINVMILFVFHKEVKQCDPTSDSADYQACLDDYIYEEDLQEQDQQLQGVIQTLGIIVIVLSMLIVLFFLAQTAPLIIKKAWMGWENDNFNIIKYIRRLLMTVVYLVTDFYVLYYLSYGFTAFLGTLYHPFFFAFHLFDVLVRYPVLLNVVKAVWEPRKSILFTLFLFIVLMYVFSLVAYYWLYESYRANFCYSTFQCLLTAVDRSFKSDGGLGGFLTPSTDVKPNDDGYFFLRFFFDNVYFILLMIIMINIVSGIIIDTFGTLREELNDYQLDLQNICFICGFDKETIEKSSKNQLGFTYHIKQEHYMWNYLFYIAYLKDKDSTEYSGIESYVMDKIKNEDTSWFPTFKALCMNDDQEGQEQGQMMNELKQIQDDQERLQELLDNINQQLEKIEEDQKQGNQ